MTTWFHQNMTSLDKIWWSVQISIFGIRNYQVSKHVASVLSNDWLPSLLYTNQVIMFLHSTDRSADTLNPGFSNHTLTYFYDEIIFGTQTFNCES